MGELSPSQRRRESYAGIDFVETGVVKRRMMGRRHQSRGFLQNWREDLKLIIVLPLALIVIPFIPLWILFAWAKGKALLKRARQEWKKTGTRLLLVYSESPVWQTFIESNWLPRLGKAAVVLNWTHRKHWQDLYGNLERDIFQHWSGDSEFNPMAICLAENGNFEIIRFWKAFRDFKHGKPESLFAAQDRLFKLAGVNLEPNGSRNLQSGEK